MIPLLQLIAGLALLYFGGEWLVRGASALATRLGVTPLAIGLTVVAFGTSTPELVVSLNAALSGANDISVGNVVGSNIANLGLILGLASLVRPAVVEAKIVRIDAPIMTGVSLLLIAALWNGTASRLEGLLLFALLLAYGVYTFWEATRESVAGDAQSDASPPQAGTTESMPISLLFVVLGVGALVAGGHFLVTAAVAIASAYGVSQAVIGLTVVAVGTSLPEFTTAVIASIRGKGDIAIGGVIGSNIFNVLGILGLTAVVKPLERGEIAWLDLGTMLALAVLVSILIATRMRLERFEGAILLAVYVLYTGSQVAA